MSLLPLDNPIKTDELAEQAKQAALQQAGGALVDKAAGAAGKTGQKIQKAAQIAQQVKSASGLLNGAGVGQLAGGAGGGLLSQVPGASGMFAGGTGGGLMQDGMAGNAPVSTPPPLTAAGIAASLQPVWVGCDVNIDGKTISPVLSLNISQTHGDHNRVEIHFPQRSLGEPDFSMESSQSLLGRVAEVIIKNRNNADGGQLENNFVIATVSLEQDTLNDGIIIVTGYSPTILLDGAPHYESFHNKTLKDIATIIGKPLQQVKGSIKPDPTLPDTLIYTCRYNESAWNFLKRLSAETGQWLYYNGTTLIFGKPEKRASLQLTYGSNCYHLKQQMQISPLQTGLFDYNAATHKPLSGQANSYADNAGSYAETAFKKSKELYGTPTHVTPSYLDGEKPVVEAISKARSAGRASDMFVMRGESTIYELRVGALVDITFKRMGVSSEHSPMRIISVHHSLDASGDYSNSFEAIPASAEMPPPPYYTKPVTYPMLAVVLSNKDPQNQGRVQVQFMGWQQDHSNQETDWIRVLTPDAGGGGEKVAKNRGLVTIPEVGDQVMIDFERGNPDRPFVTGSIFHGMHGAGGGEGNNSKSLISKSGHTVHLNDAGGITVVDKSKLNHIVIDGENAITVTAEQTITLQIHGGSSIILNKEYIVLKGTNIQVDATGKGGNIIAASEGNTIIKSNAAGVAIDGNQRAQVTSASVVYVEGSAGTVIKGGVVEINS